MLKKTDLKKFTMIEFLKKQKLLYKDQIVHQIIQAERKVDHTLKTRPDSLSENKVLDVRPPLDRRPD